MTFFNSFLVTVFMYYRNKLSKQTMRPDKKKVRHHDSRKKAVAAKQKAEGPQQEKPRRVIESNWEADKPDLPDENSDEGDGSSGVFTGLDFNYVLENSLTADALLRTKAELEWERERQDVFTTEHFSMDLASLEKAMACVPIHHQLGIDSLSVRIQSSSTLLEEVALFLCSFFTE